MAQNVAVVAAVLALHGAALWALQNGLVERATPPALALPRVITAQLIAAAASAPAAKPAEPPKRVAPPSAEPPAPVAAPKPVPRKVAPEPPRAKAMPPQHKPVIRRPVPPPPAPVAPEPPQPVARGPVNPQPAPANTAPAPTAATSAPATTASAATATAAAPAPAPRTVLPSSSAAYLNNTPPPYPTLARRLGESGTVVVRVLIGTNGRAEKAQIEKSSGYERLDQAALETARDRWRYVPGTRNGVPEAMWFKVPIKFVLE